MIRYRKNRRIYKTALKWQYRVLMLLFAALVNMLLLFDSLQLIGEGSTGSRLMCFLFTWIIIGLSQLQFESRVVLSTGKLFVISKGYRKLIRYSAIREVSNQDDAIRIRTVVADYYLHHRYFESHQEINNFIEQLIGRVANIHQ
jgi:hypothetical protein